MIFACSLGGVCKKAFGETMKQVKADTMAEYLSWSPKRSGMSVAIICPNDLKKKMLKGNKLGEALLEKHDDILVVYLYTNDKEKKLVPQGKDNLFCVKVSRYTAEIIETEVNNVASKSVQNLTVGGNSITIMDTITPNTKEEKSDTEYNEKPIEATQILKTNYEPENSKVEKQSTAIKEEQEYDEDDILVTESEVSIDNDIDAPRQEIIEAVKAKTEDEVKPKSIINPDDIKIKPSDVNAIKTNVKAAVSGVMDVENDNPEVVIQSMESLKKSLDRDVMMREILKENSNVSGLMTVMVELEKRMNLTVNNTNLSPTEKLNELRKLGVDKSTYVASKNNVMVAKLQTIMETITQTAINTVDERISSYKRSIEKVNKDKEFFYKNKELNELVKERVALIARLSETMAVLSNIYQLMADSAIDLIEDMPKGLPSENEYISGLLRVQKDIFKPANFEALANMIQRDLAENRIQLSAVNDKISSFMKTIAELYNVDAEIMERQSEISLLLQSNNVESVIIPDNILKTAIRCYVGTSGIGTTATVLTRTGVEARQGNTVLIDIRPNNKQLEYYGVEPIDLDEFIHQNIEQPLIIARGDLHSDSERLEEVIAGLIPKLEYYRNINILMDESQIAMFNAVKQYVLSIFFITDSTPRSIEIIKNCIDNADLDEKVAKNCIIIDPVLDPLDMLISIVKDPTVYKLIPIPYIRDIRACSLNKTKPYTIPTVVEIFEETFR